jgi:glycyl-tRNA synthetase
MAEVTMDKIVSLCKRRGFIFQSSEIYGGLNGAYDYGPLGVQLKNHIRDFWWKEMTQIHDDIVGLDASILMHPRVWEASGHVSNFSDPMVDCKQCKSRFRADQIDLKGACPTCGTKDSFTEPRNFNLMFSTHIGANADASSIVYLRPETAQGIYVDFKNVVSSSRVKIPFGIAQVGKAFRNEITTKNFIFRSCEFEQMEMQWFCKPGSDEHWFSYWREQRMAFYHKMGIKPSSLRWHQHGPDELAFYAKDAYDIQFLFPMGWQELEGVHSRTDYDLTQHQTFSGKDMSYLDQETTSGTFRMSWRPRQSDPQCPDGSFDAYDEQELEEATSGLFSISILRIAPITVAVLPLVKKDGIGEYADKLEHNFARISPRSMTKAALSDADIAEWTRSGTPYCVTVDYDTLKDDTVTLRFRDSMEQVRVSVSELAARIKQ